MRDKEKKLQAILFDLDGTLIDTTNLILRCFEHTWQTVCAMTHAREALIATFGIPLREAMRQLAEQARTHLAISLDDETLLNRLLSEYRAFNLANHDTLAQPFEGTRQVLDQLRMRGYRTGIVTSKSRELAVRGLKLCALDGLIDEAIFLEDTMRHKPEPEPILAALSLFNLPAQAAVYVGDSSHDMMAGRAAGVMTVAALWGPMPRAELENQQPDHLAQSVFDLLEIFD